MLHPVARLIDAVRALRTYRSPSGDPTVVRVACGAGEFPKCIAEIHDALEGVNAGAAFSVIDDVDKLKRGLNAAVTWVSLHGGDIKDFESAILAAISEKPKKPKSFSFVPKFHPTKNKRRWRPDTSRRTERLQVIGRVDDYLKNTVDVNLAAESVRGILPVASGREAMPKVG
jgi:hypothetical protein